MFEVNEIAEMTLQGQKSKSLEKKKNNNNNNNMNLRHHLTCRFAAGKNLFFTKCRSEILQSQLGTMLSKLSQ